MPAAHAAAAPGDRLHSGTAAAADTGFAAPSGPGFMQPPEHLGSASLMEHSYNNGEAAA